ncbi:MAG TPA: CPBP family intramembrane glutamic endopeptidase [Acidobacteriaceae bacterium]|nr:CPBP family intramembrane glutamic endopeptidase [Acidobacteriaceae bacterium]
MSTLRSDTVQTEASQPAPLLAPLWHTGIIIVLLLGISVLNALTHHLASQSRSHLAMYAVTLVWEWILLALVHWGLLMRGTPLRRLLGLRRRGAAELWTDIAIALGFWFASLIVLGAVGLLLRLAHLHPEDIRGVVSQMAPASAGELAFWIALSISAGICEELIFRGYLQQQFTALTHHVWLGIAISAVFFGLAHGYEGKSGVLLIVLYGAFFGILAHLRRSLRAGMFAHAWHDSVSGVVLYFASHLLHRIPH